MKLRLEMNYKYIIILSLANKEIKMSKIEGNILDSVKKYNSYSLKSVNKKKISHHEVDYSNDLLLITLESEESLPVPVRGLRYFTQVIMDDVGEELRNEIVRKKSFFRVVDVKEVTNLKLEKSEETDGTEKINILTNDIKLEEKNEIQNIDLGEVYTLINEFTHLLLKETYSQQERRQIEAIKEILKVGEREKHL